jgi:hypothetical protein
MSMQPNKLFDTDAQARPPLRGSWCMRAGQLRRYAAEQSVAAPATIRGARAE